MQTVKLTFIFILMTNLNICFETRANFEPGFSCTNSTEHCLSGSGYKVIDGVREYRDCWEYSYTKTCEVSSKNNCHLIEHCHEVALKDCLMKDNYGNCVNQLKEFACERKNLDYLEHGKLKQNLSGDEARKVVCQGIPCIDGNCIDKSYDIDADMMNSVSQLYSASRLSGSKDLNIKLFEGFAQVCKKKPTGYQNCCKIKGWGTAVGASCSADEKKLSELRNKRLCVYVGKTSSGTKGFKVNKHHFCCFGNMFNKVFQVEARKQLGLSFGTGESPQCQGLTVDQILKLDFEKIDFSEFVEELHSKMKLPNISDIDMRTKDTLQTIKPSENKTIKDINNREGVNNRLESTLEEGDYAQ